MKRLVLASGNKDKIEELRTILQPLGITLLSTYDFPDLKEVSEDKQTLEGNALKKARYTAGETGLPAVADDTGLEVDALDGEPGVYSARYAGEEASYLDNMNKLLEELSSIPTTERTARFRTVVAFIDSDREQTFHGVCDGRILKEPRGSGGFGYDPVFQPREYRKTFAELSPEQKHEISHRGRAIAKFVEWLRN